MTIVNVKLKDTVAAMIKSYPGIDALLSHKFCTLNVTDEVLKLIKGNPNIDWEMPDVENTADDSEGIVEKYKKLVANMPSGNALYFIYSHIDNGGIPAESVPALLEYAASLGGAKLEDIAMADQIEADIVCEEEVVELREETVAHILKQKNTAGGMNIYEPHIMEATSE